METYECVNKNTDKGDPVDVVHLNFQKASPKAIRETTLPHAILGGILWQVKKSLLVNFVDQYAFLLA